MKSIMYHVARCILLGGINGYGKTHKEPMLLEFKQITMAIFPSMHFTSRLWCGLENGGMGLPMLRALMEASPFAALFL